MTSFATLRTVFAGTLLASSAACTTMPSGPAGDMPSLAGPVMTANGAVRGTDGKVPGVRVFKGIPFAAPPVGDLRWEMPQPAASWNGVRDATQWGDSCVQNPAPERFPVNSATDMPDSPGISEDCLYLNVWTPAQSAGEDLPVMVWLYGGAYTEGGGSSPFSQGDYLADKGVIVVTFNYRVGPFGFFAHPDLTAASEHGSSGNQALGDAMAALRWVKENITAFGGDPANVTIFGESAGAAMDAGLTGAPPAAGLFQRAISQSGAWMGLGIAPMVAREQAEERAVTSAQEAFETGDIAELRALPAERIQQSLRGQGMIVDGWIIPEDLSRTFAEGRQNKVDVLVGSNEDEGSFTAAFGPPATLASWQEGEAQRWGERVALGSAAYPASTDAEASAVASMPFSDAMAWHMRLFAQSQADIGQQAWLYWFTHDPPYDEGRGDLGAAHTGEIPYVFDNLAAPRTFPGGSSVEKMAGNPREEAFADQVSQYWVNFARTGNPNGEGLPYWPPVDELAPTDVMVLDADGSGRGSWLSDDKNTLYDALYQDRVGGPMGVANND